MNDPLTNLVMLPGLDGTGVMFRPLLGALPDDQFRPVLLPYPVDERLGYRELFDLIVPQLPVGEPFLLLAESFGGPLALSIAAANPPGLRGVVLSATFVRNPIRFRPRWLRHLARPIGFQLFPLLSRFKAKLGGYLTKELTDLSIEALSQVRPDVLAHRVRETMLVDVRTALQDCPVPILYLQAGRDRVVWRHNCEEIRQLRPDVIVRTFAGAPHWLLQTRPAETAIAISKFDQMTRSRRGD